jgi:hypothetical protein
VEQNFLNRNSETNKIDYHLQGVAKLTYSQSCREKSQESRKNKIKNIGGGGGLYKDIWV